MRGFFRDHRPFKSYGFYLLLTFDERTMFQSNFELVMWWVVHCQSISGLIERDVLEIWRNCGRNCGRNRVYYYSNSGSVRSWSTNCFAFLLGTAWVRSSKIPLWGLPPSFFCRNILVLVPWSPRNGICHSYMQFNHPRLQVGTPAESCPSANRSTHSIEFGTGVQSNA